MSGYKRVNFYELCRLCATNQQKEKTHIFQEEGRKIQLQTKIQSCLSISVCEDDFLPKVVCSKCLRTLEVCYTFRQECVSSETMLSTYFKNFRGTEDFKKSGEVYIKDTTPKSQPHSSEPPTNELKPTENIPYYSLQLPTIVTNNVEHKSTKPECPQPKIHPQAAFNLNLPTKPQPKVNTCESVGNVVVNSNGEVLNIAQLVDFESLLSQAQKKPKITSNPVKKKELVPPLVKIDLTNGDSYDTGQKVVASIKQPPKMAHIKIDEKHSFSQDYYGSNYSNSYQVTTPEPSTVNLNVLTQDLNQNVSRPFGDVKREETSKLHNCEICHKSFKRREHLYQHVKLHTGFRPYTCESCSKAFMRKEHLLRHMTSHSGQKNYTCNICDKSFSRNDNLLKHKKTHEKQTSYTCDICQKQFVMKHYYVAHKLTHDTDNRCNLTAATVWGVLKT